MADAVPIKFESDFIQGGMYVIALAAFLWLLLLVIVIIAMIVNLFRGKPVNVISTMIPNMS